MDETAKGSLRWFLAVVILLASLVLYRHWLSEENSDIPLVETDCGTLLGEKDPTYQTYVFKVGLRF